MEEDSHEQTSKIYDTGSIESLKRFQRSAGKCPNCGNFAYGYADDKRGELICIACGFVKHPSTTDASGIKAVPRKPKPDRKVEGEILIEKKEHEFLTNGQKYQKIWNLQSIYEPRSNHSTTEYRYIEHKQFAQIVKSQFQMTHDQLQYVYDVLDYLKMNGGLRKLHHRCTSDRIVLAICIFAMWRSYRFIDIQSDTYVRQVGLAKNQYNTISKKLMEYDSAIREHATHKGGIV